MAAEYSPCLKEGRRSIWMEILLFLEVCIVKSQLIYLVSSCKHRQPYFTISNNYKLLMLKLQQMIQTLPSTLGRL